MKELHEKHGSFDLPMLSDHIDYEDSDDIAHLYDLANNCCSTANLNAHADIIREKSVQRQLLACARQIKEEQKKSMSEQELIVSYLEETAEEIKSATVDAHYLKIILFEINQAFVGTIKAIENEQEPFNAPTLADLHCAE
jgi:replicative DNA helicase